MLNNNNEDHNAASSTLIAAAGNVTVPNNDAGDANRTAQRSCLDSLIISWGENIFLIISGFFRSIDALSSIHTSFVFIMPLLNIYNIILNTLNLACFTPIALFVACCCRALQYFIRTVNSSQAGVVAQQDLEANTNAIKTHEYQIYGAWFCCACFVITILCAAWHWYILLQVFTFMACGCDYYFQNYYPAQQAKELLTAANQQHGELQLQRLVNYDSLALATLIAFFLVLLLTIALYFMPLLPVPLIIYTACNYAYYAASLLMLSFSVGHCCYIGANWCFDRHKNITARRDHLPQDNDADPLLWRVN